MSSVDDAAMPERIEEGQVVMAFHGGLLYKSKVLKIEGSRAFVHYDGWRKTHDSWLELEDLRAHDAETVALAKRLMVAAKAESKKRKSAASKGAAAGASAKRSKTTLALDGASAGAVEAQRDLTETDPGELLTIPLSLKRQLVEEWETLTSQPQRLVKLPCSPTVDQVLQRYVEAQSARAQQQAAQELTEGLHTYFNRCLGTLLLYRVEAHQFDEYCLNAQEKTEASGVYGANHLLRLFVKLPQIIADANLAEREVAALKQRLDHFLEFLRETQNEAFTVEYEEASPAYMRQCYQQQVLSASSSAQ